MNKAVLLGLTFAGVTASSTPAAVLPLLNGDFSVPPVPVFYDNVVNDWTQSGSAGTDASAGALSGHDVFLNTINGAYQSTIAQTLPSILFQTQTTYTLSVYLGNAYYGGGGGGGVAEHYTLSVSGTGPADYVQSVGGTLDEGVGGWHLETLTFTTPSSVAGFGNIHVEIGIDDHYDAQLLISNVTLTSAPEPTTLVAGVGALSLVAVNLRRRLNRTD